LKEWPNGQHRANGLVLHHIRSRFASGFSEKVGPPDRWRIAGGIHSEDGGKNCGLSVEVRKFKDKNDQEGDLLRDGVLRDGQWVGYDLKHDGNDPLWVTVLYLDANLGIEQALPARGFEPQEKPYRFLKGEMSTKGGSVGLEGRVVFATPQAVQKEKPNFSFLEQQPLAGRERGESKVKPPDTLRQAAGRGRLQLEVARHDGPRPEHAGGDLAVVAAAEVVMGRKNVWSNALVAALLG
jgi:hypothetical protein